MRDGHIVKTSDFKAVRHSGRGWANRLAVVRTKLSGMPTSRVGFSVGRHVGNAVVRNRVKRRLREVVRQASLRDGWDMVFIARPPAAQAGFWELKGAVLNLLRRANVTQGTKKE
jgi:ribonuclease P protein component